MTLITPPNESFHVPVDIWPPISGFLDPVDGGDSTKWPPDGPEWRALTTFPCSSFFRHLQSWSSGPIRKRVPFIKVKGATLVWKIIFSSLVNLAGYDFFVRYLMTSLYAEGSPPLRGGTRTPRPETHPEMVSQWRRTLLVPCVGTGSRHSSWPFQISPLLRS